jgi:hypothetical protein
VTSNNILFGEPVGSLAGAGGGALKAGSGYHEPGRQQGIFRRFSFSRDYHVQDGGSIFPGINEGEATMHNLVGLKLLGSHLAWHASPQG